MKCSVLEHYSETSLSVTDRNLFHLPVRIMLGGSPHDARSGDRTSRLADTGDD